MKENKFKQSGFEESVWVLRADEQFPHIIHLSAHINDTLILCENTDTLQNFKTHFLTRFEGTDEGEVTEYLGCDIVSNRAARTLTLRQASYIRWILAAHSMTDANPVKMQLEPGVSLLKRDCPAQPGWHCRGWHHVEHPE
mmetsp:Transcript_20028/g.40794  ORF Transcript_20028/g.40794 Transcript_20028/m.40794 type:complete len:140 (+) Transcript_20028:342-761(+)